MNDYRTVQEALNVFQAGPNAPDWNSAACYLLSDNAPVAIRDQVEASISETVEKIYGFVFQADSCTESGEATMTVRELSTCLGIKEHQLMDWARWLEARYGEPVITHASRLNRLQ